MTCGRLLGGARHKKNDTRVALIKLERRLLLPVMPPVPVSVTIHRLLGFETDVHAVPCRSRIVMLSQKASKADIEFLVGSEAITFGVTPNTDPIDQMNRVDVERAVVGDPNRFGGSWLDTLPDSAFDLANLSIQRTKEVEHRESSTVRPTYRGEQRPH